METIHGIEWIKNFPDRFVTWGSELKLYQVKKAEECDNSTIFQLSPKTGALVLATENRFQYMRAVAPSFHKKILVAVGQDSGRVGLCNFEKNTDSYVDFTPRQARTCLCLAWSEFDPNLLAIGHDRSRLDHCITIWDTERGLPKDSSNLIGLSETANSLCWDNHNRLLVAGMSQKNIKLFDVRCNNANCHMTNTRLVHGLTITPNGKYLASFVDTVIGIWDLRNLEKALTQIQNHKNIKKLAWCPLRSSYLSVVQRESPYLNLIEVYGTDIEDCYDVYSTRRLIAAFDDKTTSKILNVADISWHPEELDKALALSENSRVTCFQIPERVAISWSSQNQIACSIGLKMAELDGSVPKVKKPDALIGENYIADDWTRDIRDVMYERASNGYGLMDEVRNNGDLAQNIHIKLLWNALANISRDDRLSGLKAVLGVSGASDGPPMSRSETQTVQWPDYVNSSSTLLCYRSEQRDHAQHFCGWTFKSESENSINKFITELCLKKEFCRAAMISVLYLKIKPAIEILTKAADQTPHPNESSALRMAAIALSGFNADRCTSLWKSQRTSLPQINDASLRTIFAFLTTSNDNFESVLMEKEILLGDRVAFACRYLNDAKLAEYVKSTIQTSIEMGDLNGLLLTGESPDAVNILQTYLDNTGDVQTVALIAIRFFHYEMAADERTKFWISSYRNLLDSWGLWGKRAEIDMKIEHSGPKQSRSVFLSCNFCCKSVSAVLQEELRMRNTSSNINKLSSCPHCRKPLPRCALCLLHLGTTTFTSSKKYSSHNSLGWQSKPFSNWFSWCQTCRHGGHTDHLIDWFKTNSECPITTCGCKCFGMDQFLPKFLEDEESG